ncbi:CPBP family intramembrane metalloprotease [Enterococcus sp. ALS3]|uniref:CPBP family intramembrane metalloprotease n=1 Tax=Enterococcus alishanensis TaxID=1303817 RepID=A0ABS6TI35_9ENTE|nr:CPBP family intramembrane glutamic endopeptidase [Enterococcus alishanensis]MBV7392497.1 CPBP family intramembrane metalloprotease [Enterococcus alishanensis]
MNNDIKKCIYAILYSLLIGIVGMGVPLVSSFLLFGLSGINTNMVYANNMLMGVIGGPAIYLLTKKYFNKKSKSSEILDVFTQKGIKRSISGIIVGIALPTLLFIIIIVCGGNVVLNISIHWISIITSISTFIGMSILEECIFRGILQSTFEIYGKFLSIIIPTTLFTLMHINLWIEFNLLSLIELFCAGILFVFIMFAYKNLTCVIIAHLLYNILSSVFFGIESTEGILKTIMPSTTFNLPGEKVIQSIFIVVQIILISIFILKNKKSNLA